MPESITHRLPKKENFITTLDGKETIKKKEGFA